MNGFRIPLHCNDIQADTSDVLVTNCDSRDVTLAKSHACVSVTFPFHRKGEPQHQLDDCWGIA